METVTIDMALKFAIRFTLAILIGYFIGRKKNIGGWYSFLLSVFFPSIFGLILTIISSNYSPNKLQKSSLKKKIGIFLMVLGSIILITCLACFILMPSNYGSEYLSYDFEYILKYWMNFGCGIFISGMYLFDRGAGLSYVSKVYKDKYLAKKIITEIQNIPSILDATPIINEKIDKYLQKTKLSMIQNYNPMITTKQIGISLIVGLLLSIFFNSGPYFGKLTYYTYEDSVRIEMSAKSAKSNYRPSNILEVYETNWDEVFYGFLTFFFIGILIFGFIVFNKSQKV